MMTKIWTLLRKAGLVLALVLAALWAISLVYGFHNGHINFARTGLKLMMMLSIVIWLSEQLGMIPKDE